MDPLNFWPSAVAATAVALCVCSTITHTFPISRFSYGKLKESHRSVRVLFFSRSVSLCKRSLRPSKSIGTSRQTNEQKGKEKKEVNQDRIIQMNSLISKPSVGMRFLSCCCKKFLHHTSIMKNRHRSKRKWTVLCTVSWMKIACGFEMSWFSTFSISTERMKKRIKNGQQREKKTTHQNFGCVLLLSCRFFLIHSLTVSLSLSRHGRAKEKNVQKLLHCVRYGLHCVCVLDC